MIVCHCQAVSDRTIRRAIRDGASTTAEVASACRAGARCGGCHAAIEAILEGETIGRIALRTTTAPAAALREAS